MKTTKETRKEIEGWQSENIVVYESGADTYAKYAVGHLFSMIAHVVTIDEKYQNQETAFDADYILKRFKDLALLWARAKLDAPEVEQKINVIFPSENIEVLSDTD